MPHQLTVTGKTGPDRTVTAQVLQNVTQVLFNPDLKQVRVRTSESGNIKDFDITAATTITVSVSAGNYTFSVA